METESKLAALAEECIPSLTKAVEIRHVMGMSFLGRDAGKINVLPIAASHNWPLTILALLQARIGRDVFLLCLYSARRDYHSTGLIQKWSSECGMVAPSAIHPLRRFVVYSLLDL
jgi:hypothetical protein